jgi:hypothetical protein
MIVFYLYFLKNSQECRAKKELILQNSRTVTINWPEWIMPALDLTGSLC